MKKIIKRIAAIICVAVFAISNIVMPVSASFGIGVSSSLVALVSYVLVVGGVITAEQASTYTDSQIINEYYRWSTDPLGTFGYTMANMPVDDKMKSLIDLVIGSLEYTGFADWVDDSKDDVVGTTDDPVDMHGYGASCLQYDKSTGALYVSYYGEYGIITWNGIGDSSSAHIFNGYFLFSSGYSKTFDGDHMCAWVNTDTEYYDIFYYGDWRFEDGSAATGFITGGEEDTSIGTVIINGVEYPINEDGTVTIDGVTYVINDDGSLTVGDTTYYPDYTLPYDDTALRDLLNRILAMLNTANVPDDTVDETTDDIIEKVDPVVIADADFSKLTMDKSIATVFPFCIPWDFYNGLKLLATNPVAPRFEVPFEVPQYGPFPGVKKMIVVDFSEYEQYFYIVRWGMFTISMFGMCFLTFKIVKGA